MTASKRLLNLKEVSAMLNMNTEVLRRWLRNGKLPGVKVGSDWRVNAADLDPFLNPAGNSNQNSISVDNAKKMCFRFPKWLEFSGLPKLLNEKLGPETWPIFKKLIELDFEIGKPTSRLVPINFVELAERTGYDEKIAAATFTQLCRHDLVKLHKEKSGDFFSIVTPIKTPKLIFDISYEHGGIKGAPSKALENSCLRRFLESGDLS